MLRIYPSNKTESLAAVMAALMRAQPLEDPFARELVLIQSQGMGLWLQQQLSESLGIAAMIETQMPASFVWKLSESLMPGPGVSARFDKAALRWEIFRRLPECLEQDVFAPLRTYAAAMRAGDPAGAVVGDVAGESKDKAYLDELQYFRLSEAIADSFDAYQNYRGDWIAAWEQDEGAIPGEDIDTSAQEQARWQAALWQQLYPEIKPAERKHRPGQLQQLQQLLESGTFDKQRLPKRMFVFGLSALPPQWLPVFLLLGRTIDIHFLVPNPCQYYWGDIQNEVQALRYQKTLLDKGVSAPEDQAQFLEGNSLLASWGRLGRDYLGLLYRYDETHGVEEFAPSLFESWLDEDQEPSALQWLQQDVLELNARNHAIDPADDSLRFASCHSRLREVEALKDYLADALEKDAQLELRDILVMMPDVQLYAPFIQAVFSKGVLTAAGTAQYLPFAISDQSLSYDQNLVDALRQILSIRQSRVRASEVMDWLSVDAIRSRFGMDKDDLERVHAWLDVLNVRWGLSGAHRSKVLSASRHGEQGPIDQASQSDHNTWLKLAQRMLSGYLVGGEEPRNWDGQSVMPAIPEGQDAQVLLGRLLRFLEVIEHSIELLQGKRPATEWIDILYQVWQKWFDAEIVAEDFSRLFDKIAQNLRSQFNVTCFNEQIDFSVIASAFEGALDHERVSQRFLAGRINFCTLMPMRSIPFKQVCLLGMNDGEYPRPRIPSGFDLMQMTPARAGDRSAREDDRYLFLEALMSVRKRLYISFIGHSAQDNSARFPSVLVSELQAWCREYFTLAGPNSATESMPAEQDSQAPVDIIQHWTMQHRLQSFHADYYLGRNAPASYAQQWLDLYQAADSAQIVPPAARSTSSIQSNLDHGYERQLISLRMLADAVTQPLRFYYRQGMQLQAPRIDSPLLDEEPFALDGLITHQLKVALLAQERLGGTPAEQARQEVLQRWSLLDRLPGPPLDQMEIALADEGLAHLREQMATLGPLQTLRISRPEDGWQVDGSLLIESERAVFLHMGKKAKKNLFADWVYHVFLNVWRHSEQGRSLSSGLSGQSLIICAEESMTLPELEAQDAQAYARSLLVQWESSLASPLYFLPDTAFATLFGSASARKNAFMGTNTAQFTRPGECDDFYFQRALRHSTCQPVLAEDGIPDFATIPVFEQVQAHAAEIKEGGP